MRRAGFSLSAMPRRLRSIPGARTTRSFRPKADEERTNREARRSVSPTTPILATSNARWFQPGMRSCLSSLSSGTSIRPGCGRFSGLSVRSRALFFIALPRGTGGRQNLLPDLLPEDVDILPVPATVPDHDAVAEAAEDGFQYPGLADGDVRDERNAATLQFPLPVSAFHQQHQVLDRHFPFRNTLPHEGRHEIQDRDLVLLVRAGKALKIQTAVRVDPSVDDALPGQRFPELGDPLRGDACVIGNVPVVCRKPDIHDELRLFQVADGVSVPFVASLVDRPNQIVYRKGLRHGVLRHENLPWQRCQLHLVPLRPFPP